MVQPAPFPIRKECPPGACDCGRDILFNDAAADLRILQLTREEEKKLIARIEAVSNYADLKKLQERMHALLGMVLRIGPGMREVRTARGFQVELLAAPGLCRKTRQTIPAAIRKCLDRHPEIAFAILDAHDLFGGH